MLLNCNLIGLFGLPKNTSILRRIEVKGRGLINKKLGGLLVGCHEETLEARPGKQDLEA